MASIFARWEQIGYGPWRMAGTLLQWTSGVSFHPDVRNELSETPGIARVVRRQHIRFHLGLSEWYKMAEKMIEISQPLDYKMGRTSIVRRLRPTCEGRPVATVSVALVVTDRTLRKTVPIPPRVRELVSRYPTAEEDLPPFRPQPRPAGAFRWRTEARYIEIDHLRHLNQSVYAFLVEEARAVAAAEGGYPEGEAAGLARQPPQVVDLDYVGQAHPGDALSVYTWWDGVSFRAEIEKDATPTKPAELFTRAQVFVVPLTPKL
eukprot:Hpha_TRINITY_DN7205_c0_g1::TRINITY_DN7205_c0_g1_i1::g.102119::m.102119